MSIIQIRTDFSKTVGKIKQMHAIGQPPFTLDPYGPDFTPMQYIADANIRYSRLHDTAGPFGSNRFVDIPNIFRDFDADETDPANYDFIFTDRLLAAMHEYGIQPIYRLGVTIEIQSDIRAYHIHPPKDFAKWARICEHIIRHYNEGWADGFHYGIEYWEIWNEPDNRESPEWSMTWTGTNEQFFEFYDVAAKHLKQCFGDSIKVGGYAATDFSGINYHPERYRMNVPKREIDSGYYRCMNCMDFLYGFFEYIRAHSSPLDFFSWHCYGEMEKVTAWADLVERTMQEYGYGDAEDMLNEWNWPHNLKLQPTAYAAASAVAFMCALQNKKTSMLCYYDARVKTVSPYCGMFHPITQEPYPTYYGFYAFGQLYALGNQTELQILAEDGTAGGAYGLAATDGERKALLLVNYTEAPQTFRTDLGNEFRAFLVDETHSCTEVSLSAAEFTLEPNQTVLLKTF